MLFPRRGAVENSRLCVELRGCLCIATAKATLETFGNALRMDYALMVSIRDGALTVQVEDWLWRMEPDVVVNKSTMRKWGFRIGEIVTTIVRKPDSDL